MGHTGVLVCWLLVLVHGSFQAPDEDPRIEIIPYLKDQPKMQLMSESSSLPEAESHKSDSDVSPRLLFDLLGKITGMVTGGKKKQQMSHVPPPSESFVRPPPPPVNYLQPPPGGYAQPPQGSYAQPPPGNYVQAPPVSYPAPQAAAQAPPQQPPAAG